MLSKQGSDIKKTIFKSLLTLIIVYAALNIFFSILMPYKALKNAVYTDMREEGKHVIEKFNLYSDMLNRSYSSISYDICNKNDLITLSGIVIDDYYYLEEICRREMVATNIIKSVVIYDFESMICYDYLRGYVEIDAGIQPDQLAAGFSRQNDALYYTGVSDIFTDKKLIISFLINEELLESLVFKEKLRPDILRQVSDRAGNRIIGNEITLMENNYSPNIRKIKLDNKSYLMKMEKSSVKDYICIFLIPSKEPFQKIYKRIAFVSVIFFLLTVLIIALYQILFNRTSVNVYLKITENSFFVDDSDYTSLMSPGDLKLLYLMKSKTGFKINCSEIQQEITGELPENCCECLQIKGKATLCSPYKKTYNQILKIKKILETLKLGTIIPPRNKLDILKEGWTLQFNKNVIMIKDAALVKMKESDTARVIS